MGITGIGSNDAEFLVLWLQQVLPHYLHFQPFPWPPAQSQVHADVAWDLDGRQRVDIAGHQVELDAASQVPCRAEIDLVARIDPLAEPRRPVRPHAEARVVAVDPPSLGKRPIAGQLRPDGVRARPVAEDQGKHPVRRRGNELGEPRAGHGGHQVVVHVVERGQVPREAFGGLLPKPDFIGHQRLGAKGIASQGPREPPGTHEPRRHQVPIDPRRRAHRARHGRPGGVPRVGRPQQPDAGLHLQARVGVLLQLGAHRQRPLILDQRDFVLHELARQVQGPLDGVEVHREIVVTGQIVVDVAEAGAAGDLLPLAQRKAILEVDVEGRYGLVSQGRLALVPVEVRLQRPVRVLVVDVAPSRQDVLAVDAIVPNQLLNERRPRRDQLGHASRIAHIVVALNGHAIGVGGVEIPIGAEAGAALAPVVVGPAVREESAAALEVLAVHAVIAVLAEPSADARAVGKLLLGAAAGRHVDALRVLGLLGDDADDAVDGIGAPQGPARAADHLDPLHVFQEHVLHVPIDAGEDRVVDGAAIDEHQKLVRVTAVEAPGGDRPRVGVDVGYLQARRHSQHLGDRRCPAAANHLLRDHKYGCRRMSQRTLLPGHGGHGSIHRQRRRGHDHGRPGELVDVQVQQLLPPIWLAILLRYGRIGAGCLGGRRWCLLAESQMPPGQLGRQRHAPANLPERLRMPHARHKPPHPCVLPYSPPGRFVSTGRTCTFLPLISVIARAACTEDAGNPRPSGAFQTFECVARIPGTLSF